MLLITNDVDFLQECGYLKIDILRLYLELKNCSLEQNDDLLNYIKNKEDSSWETIWKK